MKPRKQNTGPDVIQYLFVLLIFLAGIVTGAVVTTKVFNVDVNLTAIPYRNQFYLVAEPTTLMASRYQTTIPAGTIVKEVYSTDSYRKLQMEFLYDLSGNALVPIDTSNMNGVFIYR